MNSFGLYCKDNGERTIMFNGVEVSSTPRNVINSFGLYLNGSQLKIDGADVAMSTKENAILSNKGNNVYLSEVLLTDEGTCINITIEDYNDLRSGLPVDGYKAYDESAIYNIVADVSSAPTITYTISNGVVTFSDSSTAEKTEDMVHVVGGLSENQVDKTQTITNTKCPFVNVRYFDPIIPIGGKLKLDYYVDTQDMASVHKDEIGDTFTVIVKTAVGSTTKKTTYAGRFTIETPAFSTGGETWFSVECIDSNGVGSAVQYFNILVRNAVTPNYYTMKEADLEEFGIAVNDKSESAAYNNKAALTSFFAAVKSGEIDNSDGYNGVVMLNKTYYIDYRATYGTRTYKKCAVNTSTREITSVYDCTEEEVFASGASTSFTKGQTFPVVGDKIGDSTTNITEWIEQKRIVNGFVYYVVNTATYGDYIQFPNEFTVDLNGATIKAISCDYLQGGAVVRLTNNFDTHIINGFIKGNYDVFDFRSAAIKNGTMAPSEHMCATQIYNSRYCSFRNLDISFAVGYEGSSTGILSGDKATPTFIDGKRVNIANGEVVNVSEMVVTEPINIEGKSDIVLARNSGYVNIGTQRELFFSFYDNNDTYITTVKSKWYYVCKVPSNAVSVRITCYGNTNNIIINNSSGNISLYRGVMESNNIKYIDCYWHDTRTCALQDFIAKGILRLRCKYRNIAKEQGLRGVTRIFGDFEDGWQHCKDNAIIDCFNFKKNGSDTLLFHYCNNLTFSGNRGISITNKGGIESGFIEGNVIHRYELNRNSRSVHPFVVHKGNDIGTLLVSYNNDKGETHSLDTVEPIVAMSDTIIKSTCEYKDLKLRNSSNGGVGYK